MPSESSKICIIIKLKKFGDTIHILNSKHSDMSEQWAET